MTKLFSLVAATLAIAATSASAYSSFSLNEVQDSDNIVQMGPIMSDGMGVVEIYDFHGGTQGRLLGTETVYAGANTDVRIPLGTTASETLLALLKVDGQVMDRQVIRVEDNG